MRIMTVGDWPSAHELDPQCEFCTRPATLVTGGGAWAEFTACRECAAQVTERNVAEGASAPTWCEIRGEA
jgi:hypothetical protein